MIYLFEDRKKRMEEFLGKEYYHQLLQLKPFDCQDVNDMDNYIRETYSDAKAILLHKSYHFSKDLFTNDIGGDRNVTIDNVIKGFKKTLNIPVVLFSGGSNSNLIKDGNIMTAEINSGVMYKNLSVFLTYYQSTGKISVQRLVYGNDYLLNLLLKMQAEIHLCMLDKNGDYEINRIDYITKLKPIIDNIMTSLNTEEEIENDIKTQINKLNDWLDGRTKSNSNPMTVLLLLSQVQKLINKFQR